MSSSPTVISHFDSYYYATGCGQPYDSQPMCDFFEKVADRIVQDICPTLVLDAGCAMGFLVHALRQQKVDAFGVDVSDYAIEQVPAGSREFCRVGSITLPFDQRYDLITCIEVLEHLSRPDSEKAIVNLCQYTDDILFSSSPFDYKEATHFNVQPPEYWAEQFARQGFFRDVDFDSSFITPWAVRFRRRDEPLQRVIRDYERQFWLLWKENQDLRSLTLEMRHQLAHQHQANPQASQSELSLAGNLSSLANKPDDKQTFSAKDDDMRVVVVISHDVVGSEMAGPGIRYYHLARVLSNEFSVVLAVPSQSTLKVHPTFRVLPYHHTNDPALESALRQARTILVPAIIVPKISILRQSLVPLIVDGYNPYLAETLVSSPEEVSQLQHTLTQAYLLGDFFICASERQRDWWLGLLEAHGRINQAIFQDDRSLRSLVDLVPFGLAENLPQHTQAVIKGVWSGIKQTDKLILWGGGLWPWLDPLTAIRAIGQIWTQRQDIRLVFPGTRHPNPEMATIHTHHEAARELAQELGLLNQAAFFGDWIPYVDWANVLLESDLALSLHDDTFETRLAFRSRVLEYIWAGLPIITTKGDAISELVRHYDLGIVVDYEDVDGVAQAILTLLDTPGAVRTQNFELAQKNLTWQNVAQPIIAFCRSPRLAADKLNHLTLGNPFYLNEVAQVQEDLITQQQAYEMEKTELLHEVKHLSDLVTGYEQGRFMRLMRQIHRLREHFW